MSQEQTLDISWETIIKVFASIIIFYILFLVREIAFWFLFALAISVLLDPAINFLRRLKMPRIVAVLFIYFAIFGILGVLVYITAPAFISEIRQFGRHLPTYFEQISPILRQFGIDTADSFAEFTGALANNLQQSSQGIIKAIMVIFGGLAATISILTMAFFLSLGEKSVEKGILLLCPAKYERQIENIFERVQKKVAGWFGARLLACLFVGVASYIVFFIFDVKYAFILALLSGFLNFVPYIGPWITGITLIVLVGITSGSWTTALYVLVAVGLVQAAENNLLTPVLMKKMADVPPVLVLISLLVGAELFGFLGMVFAVPICGIIYETVKEFLQKRKEGFIEED